MPSLILLCVCVCERTLDGGGGGILGNRISVSAFDREKRFCSIVNCMYKADWTMEATKCWKWAENEASGGSPSSSVCNVPDVPVPAFPPCPHNPPTFLPLPPTTQPSSLPRGCEQSNRANLSTANLEVI